MRRLATLALLPLLTGFTPQDTPELPTHGGTIQAGLPLAGRQSFTFTWACWSAPPWTLRTWWKVADAIVRVRVDSQFAYDEVDEVTTDPSILTDLEVTMLEVFKPHPFAVPAGATMTITHPGGTLLRPDGSETHETNAFPPPANGTEWFFFLQWDEDDQRFWVSYLEDGAFQVQHDGSLIPTRAAHPSTRWRAAMGAEALAERLRTLAERLR
jgi:hypothetical protein